jgi:two-component system cell cycle response regulator DivK
MNGGGSRPRVLIVDDYPDGRDMLSEYLAFLGFPVIAANDGPEAIELATNWGPAVILMDLQMPGMDGWEVTRRLKSDAATRHIIIVALTAHALAREVTAARHAGCDAVVAKPYELAALAAALARVADAGPAAFDGPNPGSPTAPG